MVLTYQNREDILCQGREMLTYFSLVQLLRSVGLKSGDLVCVHSSLFPLGRPCIPQESFMDAIVCAFYEVIGEDGTLIMPAFSYSFCKGEVFDVEQTPSTVGVLTEYFRRRHETMRTDHPIFSFSVSGAAQDAFLETDGDAFSDNSLYGKLRDMGGKLVMFGAPRGYTFYYLAERHVGVSHRFMKNFSGTVRNAGREYECTIPYYVRHLDRRSEESEEKVDQFLNSRGIQKSMKIGRGTISCVGCKEMFDACVSQLQKDETYFLKDCAGL